MDSGLKELTRSGVSISPLGDDTYWLGGVNGGDGLGWKGLIFPDLKLYQLDADTLSLENIAGGTYKNLAMGHLGVGRTPLYHRGVIVEETYIDPITTYIGGQFQLHGAAIAGDSAHGLNGVLGATYIEATNTKNWTWPFAGVVGQIVIMAGATGTLDFAAPIYSEGNVDGMTVTTWVGLYAEPFPVTAPGVVTNWYGVNVQSPYGTGTVVNAIGIWIPDLTIGTTINYGLEWSSHLIYSAGSFAFQEDTAIKTRANNAGVINFQVYEAGGYVTLATLQSSATAAYLSLARNINIGDNRIVATSLIWRAMGGSYWASRNSADTDYASIAGDYIYATIGWRAIVDATKLTCGYVGDDVYMTLEARRNTIGPGEVARLQSAVDPWFGIGVNGAVLKGTYGGLLGFFGATPVAQQTKAAHNNWAALGDVVNALVSLGLFDTA